MMKARNIDFKADLESAGEKQELSCSMPTDAGRILIREPFPRPMIIEAIRDTMSLNLFPEQTNTSITFPLSH